jgi:ABC-type phosphate transport system substrate-binding protein
VYPFSQYTYLMLSTSVVRSTCAQKRNVLAFVSFLYQSATISFLANSQATPILPKALQTAIGVQNGLKTMTCVSGQSIYQASSTALGLIFGSAPLSTLMTRLFGLYTAFYPSSRVYNFLPGNEVQTYSLINHDSVDQVLQPGERAIDAAISVSTTPDKDSGVLHTSFPFATASVALVYSLPRGLTTADVPSLVLDLETVGMIFTGAIGNWTHPRIARLNSRLMAAFAAKPTVSRKLTVVLCCSASRGASPTLTLMRSALQPTAAFRASPLASTPTLDWAQVWTTSKRDVTSIQCDAEEHVVSLVQKTKGSLGYMRVNYQYADDTVHVRLLPWKGSDSASLEPVLSNLDPNGFYLGAYNVSIPPQPTSSQACVFFNSDPDLTKNGGAYDIAGAWLDFTKSTIPATCWPMTSAVQLLLPQTYSDAAVDGARRCAEGRETLQLMQWLVSSPALSSALNLEGFGRLSDDPVAQAYILSTINLVPCDGRPLLSELPDIWRLSSGISSFLFAYSGVLLFSILLSAALTWLWRSREAIRMSGVSILMIQSGGFSLLFVSAILWSTAHGPSGSNCTSFWWLVNLGFSLGFLPMGLKLWKLNRMLTPVYVAKHRRATSKITKSKLTNRKMMILLSGAIALDVILLIISTAGSRTGFTMATEEDTTGSTLTSYTHCRPDARGDPWIAALLGYKAVWVLWSVLQTFQARSGASSSLALAVKEAVHISYPLYNLTFSSLIIVPIILLLNIHGDGLVILVGVLILWTASVAWAAMFAPKCWHELKAHRRNNNLMVDGASMLSGDGASGKTGPGGGKNTGGATFTFLPLTTMSREDLARYLLSFDRHIVDAKRRLLVLGGIHLLAGQVEYRAPLLTGHDENGDYPEPSQSLSRHLNHSASRSHHPMTNGVGGAGGATSNGTSRRPSLSVRYGGGPLSPQTGRTSHQVSQVRENSVRLSLTNNYMPGGSQNTRTRQLSVQNRVVPSALGSPSGGVRSPSPATSGGMRSPTSVANAGVSFALNINGSVASSSLGLEPKSPLSPAFSRPSNNQRPPSSPGGGVGLPLHPTSPSVQGIVTIRGTPTGTRRKLTQQRPPLSQTASPKINPAATMPPVIVTFHQFDGPASADFSIGSGMVSEAARVHRQQRQHSPGETPSPKSGLDQPPHRRSSGPDASASHPASSGHGTQDSMDGAFSPTSPDRSPSPPARSPSPPSPMVAGLPREVHHMPTSSFTHSLSIPVESPKDGARDNSPEAAEAVSSPSSEDHIT